MKLGMSCPERWCHIIGVVWLMGFVLACDKNEDAVSLCLDPTVEAVEDCSEEIVIAASDCMLKSVVHEYGGSHLYTFHHDGEHYNQIEYYEDYQDTLRYQWTMDLDYDASGRVTRTTQRFQTGARHEVNFDYQPFWVMATYTLYDSLDEILFDTSNKLFSPEPIDSVVLVDMSSKDFPMDKYLFDYEHGNRVRFWELNEEGDCELYGHRWALKGKMYYDNRPNVFNDYAVLVTTGFEFQFWFKENANNWIASSNPVNPEQAPEISCHTFLTNGQGKYWIKEYRGRTYHYDCE